MIAATEQRAGAAPQTMITGGRPHLNPPPHRATQALGREIDQGARAADARDSALSGSSASGTRRGHRVLLS
jgi:hypothetical protein